MALNFKENNKWTSGKDQNSKYFMNTSEQEKKALSQEEKKGCCMLYKNKLTKI